MGTLEQTLNILLAILATSGISIMFSDYDGPFNIFSKLRRGPVKSLFSCAVCLSPWVAIVAAILLNLSLAQYLAVVGGSVILARWA